MIVVPDETSIICKHEPYSVDSPVRTLSEAVDVCRRRMEAAGAGGFSQESRVRLRNAWHTFHRNDPTSKRATHRLGRYEIRRRLPSHAGRREYVGIDEEPCPVDVHLREFPFDSTLPASELRRVLLHMAREFRILRRLRHPHLACVVGHFQTGASWVQVSDWFDGRPLDELWPSVAEWPLWQRVGLFQSIVSVLQFCHEKGVFHRNLDGVAVLLADNLQDIQVRGFDYAFDVSLESSVSGGRLAMRDPRIIPPEELVGGMSGNFRLGDIFQAGVLLYRLLSGGQWPFNSSQEHAVSKGTELHPIDGLGPKGGQIQQLARQMMAVVPTQRPEMLAGVVAQLKAMNL